MNIYIVLLGVGAAILLLIGLLLGLWSAVRGFNEEYRVWRLKRRFRPGPPRDTGRAIHID